MDILVIYNKKAGSSDQLPQLKQVFLQEGKRVVFQPLTRSLKRHVGRAVSDGCNVVVAAGGDGTVNAVASVVMQHRKLALGVVPMGTLNHFAKDIGMPSDLQKAARVILQGKTDKIDIAQVGNHYFLNNASFGLYPRLVQSREQLQQAIGKWPALAWAFIKLVPRLRRYRLRIACDGHDKTYKTPFVFIGNNPYDIHERNFTMRKSLKNGVLAVYILQAANWSGLLRISWQALKGTLKQEEAFIALEAKEVVLRRPSGRSLLIAADGEVFTSPTTSLTFAIEQLALRIIIP